MSDPTPAPSVRLNKLVQAPAASVFGALVDPEQIKSWWAPSERAVCTHAAVDARVGGGFRVEMGDGMAAAGECLAFEPGRRLELRWGWEGAPEMAGDSRVTVDLFELDNPHAGDGNPIARATEVVLTHDRLHSAIERSEHMGGWWNTLLALGYHVRGVEPREAVFGAKTPPDAAA